MAYTLYNYTPSLAAAVKFLIAFIIGDFFEAIGYAARAVNAHQAPNYSTMPYALQSLFIRLAPSLFAASIYMILGRIIRLTDGDSRSMIRGTRLTKIFVLGDVLSFLIQSGGGAIMSGAKTASKLKLGEDVIILLCCGIGHFKRRMSQNPTAAAMGSSFNWARYMRFLYFASVLIMIRCLYRVIEYIQGSTGFLQSHEYFAYIFDACLMMFVTGIFVVFHPSQIFAGRHEKMDETELIYGRPGYQQQV
ncbi:hypothetical protein N7493_011649 [Penicillium malachiteum]|uniref:Uncharacterized protein n=1 Tax=Penicillium malachiteum TaxID=1324776 RepID=A0AAD6HA63_9EURO|nr:hypothetical protein N7493_011649 [Penicillium malachiteum]